MMAKRKLTRQQQWRVDKIQQERIRRQQKLENQVSETLQQAQTGQTGLVIASHGVHYVIESEGKLLHCLARQNLGHIVCGDQVIISMTDDEQGVITALLPRRSLLAKPDRNNNSKPVAANIDQILIFTAPIPKTKPLLIDRYLVATEYAQLQACIIFNKTDLQNHENKAYLLDLAELYESIGYRVLFYSNKKDIGLEELKNIAHNKNNIFVGQSGVGKSSTIKRLLPDIDIQIGEISAATDFGKHTTSASRVYHLPEGGLIIDSPGVRDFSLWHLPAEHLIEYFREFRPFIGQCQFSNCAHESEPGCALKQAVEEGLIHPRRFQHYFQILETIREANTR